MRALFWTLLILSVNMASLAMRSKRGLLDLTGIIKCITGRSAISYASYGCFCGLGGHGSPKDDTDRCCLEHDRCYGKAQQAHCHPLLDKYKWKCVDNEANCDFKHTRCEKIICQCDKELGKCFKRSLYNKKLQFWSNLKC